MLVMRFFVPNADYKRQILLFMVENVIVDCQLCLLSTSYEGSIIIVIV